MTVANAGLMLDNKSKGKIVYPGLYLNKDDIVLETDIINVNKWGLVAYLSEDEVKKLKNIKDYKILDVVDNYYLETNLGIDNIFLPLATLETNEELSMYYKDIGEYIYRLINSLTIYTEDNPSTFILNTLYVSNKDEILDIKQKAIKNKDKEIIDSIDIILNKYFNVNDPLYVNNIAARELFFKYVSEPDLPELFNYSEGKQVINLEDVFKNKESIIIKH